MVRFRLLLGILIVLLMATGVPLSNVSEVGAETLETLYAGYPFDEVVDVAVSPDGNTVYALCQSDHLSYLYRLDPANPSGSPTMLLSEASLELIDSPTGLAISPDGDTIYIADENLPGVLSVDLTTSGPPYGAEVLYSDPDSLPWVGGLDISCDGTMLYVAAFPSPYSFDYGVWGLPLAGGSPTLIYSGSPFQANQDYGKPYVINVAVSPDGQQLFVSDRGNNVVYRLPIGGTPVPVASSLPMQAVLGVEVSLDGNTLFLAGENGVVASIDLTDPAGPPYPVSVVYSGVPLQYPTGLALSPDQATLYVSDYSYDVSAVFRLPSGLPSMTPENTQVGDSVMVQPEDAISHASPVTITFASVTESGATSLSMCSYGPTPPAGFSLGDPATFYEISTTASYTGPIAICIAYDPGDYGAPGNLRLLHYENDDWVDVTTSNDAVNGVICGGVTSLSPFIIALPTNLPPTASAGGPYVREEGSAVVLDASGSVDPDLDTLQYRWDFDNDGQWDTGWSAEPWGSCTWGDEYLGMVVVEVSDEQLTATASAAVSIGNVGPAVDTMTAQVDPVAVGTSILASASFSDPGLLDTHTAAWDWGDGNVSPATVTEANGSGTAADAHAYAASGVYTITLTVADDDGGSGQAVFRYVVVYDPSAGFVTGGGWINSPAGAYAADPSLSGKATFGFVAKYQKGATVPTGQTEFQFNMAGLNFRSTEYQWLVVAGAKAMYKGSGTINGSGDYGFMLSAVDGQINGGGAVDKFRIKIWDNTTGQVIYDNQMGDAEDAELTTAIGGGSIVIHKK